MFSKGQTHLDLLVFIFVLVVIGMAVLFGKMIVSNLNDEIQADGDMHIEAKNASANVNDQYGTMWDRAFLVIFVLYWILLLVSSFMIDTHPIFFGVMVILLGFVFLIGMMLSNVYEEISAEGDLSAFTSDFPITTWVMSNFLIITIVIGFSTGLALYAKNQL